MQTSTRHAGSENIKNQNPHTELWNDFGILARLVVLQILPHLRDGFPLGPAVTPALRAQYGGPYKKALVWGPRARDTAGPPSPKTSKNQ